MTITYWLTPDMVLIQGVIGYLVLTGFVWWVLFGGKA